MGYPDIETFKKLFDLMCLGKISLIKYETELGNDLSALQHRMLFWLLS